MHARDITPEKHDWWKMLPTSGEVKRTKKGNQFKSPTRELGKQVGLKL
jgi:hypothetical protein